MESRLKYIILTMRYLGYVGLRNSQKLLDLCVSTHHFLWDLSELDCAAVILKRLIIAIDSSPSSLMNNKYAKRLRCKYIFYCGIQKQSFWLLFSLSPLSLSLCLIIRWRSKVLVLCCCRICHPSPGILYRCSHTMRKDFQQLSQPMQPHVSS